MNDAIALRPNHLRKTRKKGDIRIWLPVWHCHDKRVQVVDVKPGVQIIVSQELSHRCGWKILLKTHDHFIGDECRPILVEWRQALLFKSSSDGPDDAVVHARLSQHDDCICVRRTCTALHPQQVRTGGKSVTDKVALTVGDHGSNRHLAGIQIFACKRLYNRTGNSRLGQALVAVAVEIVKDDAADD